MPVKGPDDMGHPGGEPKLGMPRWPTPTVPGKEEKGTQELLDVCFELLGACAGPSELLENSPHIEFRVPCVMGHVSWVPCVMGHVS